MTNEPTDKGYPAHPSTTPMPEHPISVASASSGPVPEDMPGSDSSSAASSQEQTSEAANVIALDDYPAGRGGMRMVSPASPEQSGEPAAHPDAQIGPRPSAVEMPAPS